MWIAKKKFGNYEKGDQVKEEDAKRFGSLYCAQSGDAPAPVSDNDTDKKPEAEQNSIETSIEQKESASEVSEPVLTEETVKAAETKPRKQRR